MEYKKDNRFESEKHMGQNNQLQGVVPRIQNDTKKDTASLGYNYIMRKSEKLTTALYLVTDILPDREPLKWKARETGVDVLSDITVASSIPVSEKMSLLRGVIKKIEKVAAFLDIASSARLMSEMNATMLKKEYLALKDNIEGEWSRTHERSKSILGPHFFDVAGDAPSLMEEPKKVEIISEPTPKEAIRKPSEVVSFSAPTPQKFNAPHQVARIDYAQSKYVPKVIAQTEVMRTAPHERSNVAVGEQSAPERSVTSTQPRVVLSENNSLRARPDVNRDDRRKIILALIKQKPAITVGDISKSLTGISEKTIQRELLAMVSEHILVKHGERRWSTYSLQGE